MLPTPQFFNSTHGHVIRGYLNPSSKIEPLSLSIEEKVTYVKKRIEEVSWNWLKTIKEAALKDPFLNRYPVYISTDKEAVAILIYIFCSKFEMLDTETSAISCEFPTPVNAVLTPLSSKSSINTWKVVFQWNCHNSYIYSL